MKYSVLLEADNHRFNGELANENVKLINKGYDQQAVFALDYSYKVMNKTNKYYRIIHVGEFTESGTFTVTYEDMAEMTLVSCVFSPENF